VSEDSDRAKREKYLKRLLARTISHLGEGPYDPDYMAQADDALVQAGLAYEDGRIDKEELDSKAIGFLNHYREYPKHQGGNHGSERPGDRAGSGGVG
jgi:hypothetical protein